VPIVVTAVSRSHALEQSVRAANAIDPGEHLDIELAFRCVVDPGRTLRRERFPRSAIDGGQGSRRRPRVDGGKGFRGSAS
jgi:hypothetical protein